MPDGTKSLIERLRTLQDHYSVSGQLGPENNKIFGEAANALKDSELALEEIARRLRNRPGSSTILFEIDEIIKKVTERGAL